MSLFDDEPAPAPAPCAPAPLAERMRPRTLDEFVGQEELARRPAGRCATRSSAIASSRSSSGGRRAPARRRWRASSPSVTRAHFISFSAVLVGHQGDPRGDGRGGAARRRHGPAHDPVHRRDPSLQQGAAGRLPAARRSRRHRADRRDHREPVVRGELGAAVALEGLRAEGARHRRQVVDDPAARARRSRSAGSAAASIEADDDALAGLARLRQR